MGEKGIIPMGFNYFLAGQISKAFASNDFESELEKIGWVLGETGASMFDRMVEETPKAILSPTRYTLLHSFISIFYNSYLALQNYPYFDQCFPAEDPDYFKGHLDGLAEILKEYSHPIPPYEDMFAKIVQADENNENVVLHGEEEDPVSVKEAFSKIIDMFIDGLNDISDAIENSTFFIRFKDKRFLYKFNLYLSLHTSQLSPLYFDENGSIKRCSNLPAWMKNAIMHRDNGCCQMCGKNLTGEYDSLDPRDLHFDHVVPLGRGGTNDASNFQILCQHCNDIKSDNILDTDYKYMMPWSIDE